MTQFQRRRTFSFTIAISLLFCAIAGAQTTPDFSGAWTSDPPEANAASERPGDPGVAGQRGAGAGRAVQGRRRGARRARVGDMGSGWGSTLTLVQDESQLTVEYRFFSRGDLQPPLKFVYSLDGIETENSVRMGRGEQKEISTTEWKDDKLVITTTHRFEHPATGEPLTSQVTRTLSLESPDMMVVEATRAGVLGGRSSTTRTTYRRIER